VANEYLQMFSNRDAGALTGAVQMESVASTDFEIVRRLLAAIADNFKFDHLPLVERAQAGALDGGDMDEDIFAATLGLNESVALRRIEPLDGTSSHRGLPAHTHDRDRTTNVRSHPKSALPTRRHQQVRNKQGQNRIGGTVGGSGKGFNRAEE